MLESHTQDQRAVPRYDLSLPIEVCDDSGLTGILRGTTRDLSNRGVYFVVDQEFSLGSEVMFTLTLGAEITHLSKVLVKARGKVVRTETKLEEGTKRVGVAVTIDAYDFVRVVPSEA